MKFDPAEELTDKEALKIISDIVDYGNVRFTDHVEGQMKKRGYNAQDVQYILTSGHITQKNFNDKRNNWEYRVEGTDLDGDVGKLITAVIAINRLYIITVLS